jgi:AcrR family transcriptional regulator
MATRSLTPHPARGDGRLALLDAAIRVGARAGLRGLTIRSVAAEAGVTHGLVYHHFGTRNRLIAEALEHAGQLSLGTGDLEPGTGQPEDFSRDLERMVADDPDVQAFQFELTLEARRRPELLPTVTRLYEEYREATRRELVRMNLPDDGALAHAVFAMCDGLVMQQVIFGNDPPTEPALEWLRTMLASLAETQSSSSKKRRPHS